MGASPFLHKFVDCQRRRDMERLMARPLHPGMFRSGQRRHRGPQCPATGRRHDPIPGPEVHSRIPAGGSDPAPCEEPSPRRLLFGQGLPAPYLPAERAEDRPPARTALAGTWPGPSFRPWPTPPGGAIQGCTVISLIANSQAGDYQSTNAAIVPLYFAHRCELGRWKRGNISPLDGVAASGTIGVNAPTS